MIAIGKPFVEILMDVQLTLEEYFVLYCFSYDKRDLIKLYSKNIEIVKISTLEALKDKGYLVANLPPVQCYVRKEYLYDFQKGEGEFEPCYWVSVKSIKGKALYFESLLTNYGALYDKLPLSAYVWKTELSEKQLPLDYIEIWDAFSYNISIIKKQMLTGLQCKVYMKDRKLYDGEYMFTIDSCHSEPNELNVSLSET